MGLQLSDTKYGEALSLPDSSINNLSVDGHSYNVVIENLKLSVGGNDGAWQLLYFISVDEMLSSVNSIVMGSIIVSLIALLLTAVFIFIISDGLTKKIRYLSRNIENIKDQDFEGFINVEGTDEIGLLANDINLMAVKINELINQVYKEQISKMDSLVKQREAELQALQSKINPHFLYNTLDSIRTNFMLDEKEKVTVLLASLSKLFRYSIGHGDDVATIKQEVENIKDYTDIYRIRYGKQIKINIDISEDIKDCLLPRLTMQPIVENAFIHGLKSKKNGFRIDINGKRAHNGNIFITIKDNGVGLSKDSLIDLNAKLTGSDFGVSGCVGMRNVNDRLKLFFGKQYGISADSNYGDWFLIKIEFPFEEVMHE